MGVSCRSREAPVLCLVVTLGISCHRRETRFRLRCVTFVVMGWCRVGVEVRVRLGAGSLRLLDNIVSHSVVLGQDGWTRSRVVGDAVAVWVAPLVSLLGRAGRLGAHLDAQFVVEDGDVGEVVAVVLDDVVVGQLDRVVEYAVGLGCGEVTRLSLVRRAVDGFLSGFYSELAGGG